MFFVFQFHIPFSQLWVWEHAVFTLLCRLKCLLNLSSEQRKVSSELIGKIKYESFLVQKFWSAWYEICSWPTRFSYLMHRLLFFHSTTYSKTSLPATLVVGPLVLPRKIYPCNAIKCRSCKPAKAQKVSSANKFTYRRDRSLL